METWSFVNSKGGVGKSTLTIHIAHGLMKLGYRVCIVDADRQGSIREWQERNDDSPFSIIGLDTRQTLKNISKVVNEDDFDYCLIDTPGRIVEIQAIALSVSKKIFIPISLAPWDIWASREIIELINVRQHALDGLPECPICAFIINRRKNTKLSREVLEELKKFEVPIMQQEIGTRDSFSAPVLSGTSVFDSKDSNARLQINNLINHMLCFGAPRP